MIELIGAFWTTQAESRPLQHSEASLQVRAEVTDTVPASTSNPQSRNRPPLILCLCDVAILWLCPCDRVVVAASGNPKALSVTHGELSISISRCDCTLFTLFALKTTIATSLASEDIRLFQSLLHYITGLHRHKLQHWYCDCCLGRREERNRKIIVRLKEGRKSFYWWTFLQFHLIDTDMEFIKESSIYVPIRLDYQTNP